VKVCFFGAWDPAYPRNRVLREGLHRAGAEVLEARASDVRAFRRWPALLASFLREGRGADVLLVPEFRHKDVPLARALAGGRRLVFDPLVSRHDTLVDDWRLHAPGSPQARWNQLLDRWSLGLPDVVLCDTWAHGALFESLGVPRARLRRVLVGAEDAFFAVGAADPPPVPVPVRVVYLGGFLPLHGIRVVLEAVSRLERTRPDLHAYEVQLAGTGIEYQAARERATQLGLLRVRFTGRIAYVDAPRVLADAHVVLGAFGAGEKAGRVIPHKVWQGLAAGRAVVTGDGPGLREVFDPGAHLSAVPRGDPVALAAALERLIENARLREWLGRAGRERALSCGTADRVGESLLAAVTGGGESMPARTEAA
jgi:glycosyltransferase involved in cell wall biosynthesis